MFSHDLPETFLFRFVTRWDRIKTAEYYGDEVHPSVNQGEHIMSPTIRNIYSILIISKHVINSTFCFCFSRKQHFVSRRIFFKWERGVLHKDGIPVILRWILPLCHLLLSRLQSPYSFTFLFCHFFRLTNSSYNFVLSIRKKRDSMSFRVHGHG